MGKAVDLIIFIIVVAALWWALTTILAVLAIASPFDVLAKVAFVLIAVFAGADYFRNGSWFFARRP